MDKTLGVLGSITAVGFIIGGAIFLCLWYRDRKYPGQKKLGYGFAVLGAILLLARALGVSIF